jgi:hypothetical protein
VDDTLDDATVALEVTGLLLLLFLLLSGLVFLATGEVHLVEPRRVGNKRQGHIGEEQKRR